MVQIEKLHVDPLNQSEFENPKSRWGSANTPNHNKVVKYWGAKEEIIGTYYPFIHKCHRHFKCFSKSAAITFCLIADDYEWRLPEVMEFWTLLSTGANLPADSSILSFRNQLSNPAYRRRGNGSYSSQLLMNAIIKSFNDWKRGKTTKKFMSPAAPPIASPADNMRNVKKIRTNERNEPTDRTNERTPPMKPTTALITSP